MLTEITDLPDDDLIHSINTAHRTLTRHQARPIVSLAEFHDRALAKRFGASNTVTWLMRHHDLARRTAFEYLGVGRRPREFPLVAGEFLAGTLSCSKVRFLLRYVTVGNEDELVELALRYCLSEPEQALAGRPRPRGRKPRANSFTVVADGETGGFRFWGSLDAERGTELLAALKIGELACLRDVVDVDPAVFEESEALDIEVETARREAGQQAEPGSGGGHPEAATTRFGPPARSGLLPAFLAMVHMVRSAPRSQVRAPGAQVNVMVTLDGRVVIPDRFGAESADLLRSVLNGTLRFHVLDKKGLHVNLGRSARLVSAAQENTLLTRWGHRCAIPGCSHTRFLEFHHVIDWASGGTTDLDNLIPLCSGCHALVTSGRMTIHADEVSPEMVRFRLPGGESFTSTGPELPVRDGRMGRWKDACTHGPVPVGDENPLRVGDTPDSFDDPGGSGSGRGVG